MPAATKPNGLKIATPVTANFPSEVRSATSATPLSAVSFIKPDPDSAFVNTPISPPLAYTDFLTKAMSMNSPLPTGFASGESTPDSMPGTAATDRSDCSCKCERTPPTSSPRSITDKEKMACPATAPIIPPSPFTASIPMSAPPIGHAVFPSMKLPPSPAISCLDSPMSASTARSPFSARSVHSVFDWDAALKARFAEQKKQKPSRTSVRHIREVVTRTVTYTPRIDAAPRGKRRKVE